MILMLDFYIHLLFTSNHPVQESADFGCVLRNCSSFVMYECCWCRTYPTVYLIWNLMYQRMIIGILLCKRRDSDIQVLFKLTAGQTSQRLLTS